VQGAAGLTLHAVQPVAHRIGVAVRVLSCLDGGTLKREERSEGVQEHVPLVRFDVSSNGPRIVFVTR